MSDDEQHVGTLISGTITCSCGAFETKHHALALDAIAEFDEHRRAVGADDEGGRE